MCLFWCMCLSAPPDAHALSVLVQQGLEVLGEAVVPLCSFLLLFFAGNRSWNVGRSD